MVGSESDFAASAWSNDERGSEGGAGVSRSCSPREATDDAKLDTLPVELRFDKDRNENAAAEEAVEVREEVGSCEEPDGSAEDEDGNPLRHETAVTWSPSEPRRSAAPTV